MTAAVTQLRAERDAMEEPVDDVCGHRLAGIYAGRVSVYQRVLVYQRVSGWMDVGRGDTALESLVGVYCKTVQCYVIRISRCTSKSLENQDATTIEID